LLGGTKSKYGDLSVALASIEVTWFFVVGCGGWWILWAEFQCDSFACRVA
jgi:hypothetical protein